MLSFVILAIKKKLESIYMIQFILLEVLETIVSIDDEKMVCFVCIVFF